MKKEWRRHKIGELLTIALLKDVEKKKNPLHIALLHGRQYTCL